MCFRPPTAEKQDPKCLKCGATNPTDAEVCVSCGAELPKLPPPPGARAPVSIPGAGPAGSAGPTPPGAAGSVPRAPKAPGAPPPPQAH